MWLHIEIFSVSQQLIYKRIFVAKSICFFFCFLFSSSNVDLLSFHNNLLHFHHLLLHSNQHFHHLRHNKHYHHRKFQV